LGLIPSWYTPFVKGTEAYCSAVGADKLLKICQLKVEAHQLDKPLLCALLHLSLIGYDTRDDMLMSSLTLGYETRFAFRPVGTRTISIQYPDESEGYVDLQPTVCIHPPTTGKTHFNLKEHQDHAMGEALNSVAAMPTEKPATVKSNNDFTAKPKNARGNTKVLLTALDARRPRPRPTIWDPARRWCTAPSPRRPPRELVGYKAARTCNSTADKAQGLTAWAPALPIRRIGGPASQDRVRCSAVGRSRPGGLPARDQVHDQGIG